MRALLDTNVIIHRENTKATSFTIGKLFYWLDKLHYEKLIHPYSIDELRKYRNPQMQSLYDAKIDAYTEMRCIAPQTAEFTALLSDTPKTANDQIDNQLLCELYCKRADILITEDRRMRLKADRLGLSECVFTINSFIEKCTNENPDLIDYKVLAVKKELFGNIDVTDPFFATFREAYTGFEDWFIKKNNEEAYVCRTDTGAILGFLYLKTETEEENYSDIAPIFRPKRRLKVGTFKVEASGFRLGERFIKIIFDNAIERNVKEIYVTLYMNRPELRMLYDLLVRWGFYKYGIKKNCNGEEVVLVKKMADYDKSKSVKENFPNIRYDVQKFFLPIEAQYHTPLFPDSQLRTEGNFDYLGDKAHRYALQKVYISLSYKRDMHPGDLLVIYRKGITPRRKAKEEALPLMAFGFIKKDGMTFEKYAALLIRHKTGMNKLSYENELVIDALPDLADETAERKSKYAWIFEKETGSAGTGKQLTRKERKEARQIREAVVFAVTEKGRKRKRKEALREIKAARQEYRTIKRRAEKAAKESRRAEKHRPADKV